MTLAHLLTLLVKISLITLMVSLGLGLRMRRLLEQQNRPWLVLRVVLGSCVLVPLVALVLLQLPISRQLSAGARFGIALMALSPSAPLTLRKAGVRGGDDHLAAILQVGAALLAVVSIPLLGDLFRAANNVSGWDIQPQQVAQQVSLVQVLPLGIGLLLGHWRPKLAARWAAPVRQVAFLTTTCVMSLILLMVLPKLLSYWIANPLVIPASLLMTAAALAMGCGLGGGNPQDRLTAALVTSMRNPGLALLFALTHGQRLTSVKLAIVTYLLATIVATIPFLSWARRAEKVASGL